MTSKRSRRAPVRFLLGVLYSVVVAGLFLEVFLRVFDPVGIRYYFDTATYFKAMESDPDYAYLHTPGYEATLQGVDVRINAQGLRGPEFDPAPNGRRILVLGDSVVFGWGAPQEKIFAAALQDIVRVEGHPHEVVGAGAGSWNTRTEYEYLRKRALNFAPQVLVWLIVPNDVMPKAGGRTYVPRAELDHGTPAISAWGRVMRTAAKYSYVLATFQHFAKQKGAAQQLLSMYEPDSPAWRDAENALAELVGTCDEYGIALEVFLYADRESEFSQRFFDVYSQALATHGVSAHALSPEVFAPEYRNSIVDGHPNADGHRLIAEEMYRVVRKHLQ